MIKHFNTKIFGLVQGVFFRQYIKDRADELGITGFVQNEPDGSLYVEAEGEEKMLKEFLSFCQQGPGYAKVEKVQVEKSKLKNFKKFAIEI